MSAQLLMTKAYEMAFTNVPIFQKLSLILTNKAYVLYTQKRFTTLLIPVPNLDPFVKNAIIKNFVKSDMITFANTKDNLSQQQVKQQSKSKQKQKQKQQHKSIPLRNITIKLQIDRKYLQNLNQQQVYESVEGINVNKDSTFLAIDGDNNLILTNYVQSLKKNQQQIVNPTQPLQSQQKQVKAQEQLTTAAETTTTATKAQSITKNSQVQQSVVQLNKATATINNRIKTLKYLALFSDSHRNEKTINISYIQTKSQYFFSLFLMVFVVANIFTLLRIVRKCTRYENHYLILDKRKQ